MHFEKFDDSNLNSKTLTDAKIAIVVPCYNEELNLNIVVDTLPNFVDKIVIVNDCSTDDTKKVAIALGEKNDKIVLINHDINTGVGGSIATGYEWCRDNDIDAAVVMAGDAQMDPSELPILLLPVLEEGVNYCKGNRLLYQQSRHIIPGVRFFGNSVLSLLTKFASGYWHISDSQCGYTVVDKNVLQRIDWQDMYKSYGQPNDLLIMLNIQNFIVRDVPIRPVYEVGEVSGIKIHKVMITIPRILFRRGLRRLVLKYVIYDFHPLIFFGAFGFLMSFVALGFLIHALIEWYSTGSAPILSSLAFLHSALFAVNSLFFSMWMDMQENRRIQG